MASRQFFGWQEYKTEFDPRKYLEKYYNYQEVVPESVEHFTFQQFYHIFYDVLSKVEGRKFLEIGTGPSLLLPLFAAHSFDEIYLSDFSEKNRNAVKGSLDGAPNAFDWKPRVKHVRQYGLEIDENSFEQLQKKVKDVLECNVKDPGVITKSLGTVDCVSCLLCLEAASDTLDEYREASKNVVNLLKPSGHYVQSGVLDQTEYDTGATYFRSLATTKQEVLDTLDANGIDVKDYSDYYAPQGPWGTGNTAKNVGYYVCYGIKRSN